MNVLIEVSARHVHLTQEDFAVLFGSDKGLTFRKALSQPGEFLSHERIDVVGPKKTLKNLAILGPFRSYSQVELSMTDCRSLGFEPHVRESGDLNATSPAILVGPCGTIDLTEGLIVAKRHIHMTPKDAQQAGVINKQIVSVRALGTRPLVFGDVVVRVSDSYALAFHIDTDEANAAGIDRLDLYGEIAAGL
ncbi:MAG: phosphate propanoyltransferase [Oscillospiraceae bacterium]|jgi:putative phosphotransacetylase|nr:phosphate propanoyltransferase [Oscillospiraceae bacterium]